MHSGICPSSALPKLKCVFTHPHTWLLNGTHRSSYEQRLGETTTPPATPMVPNATSGCATKMEKVVMPAVWRRGQAHPDRERPRFRCNDGQDERRYPGHGRGAGGGKLGERGNDLRKTNDETHHSSSN